MRNVFDDGRNCEVKRSREVVICRRFLIIFTSFGMRPSLI